jgi:hypothetical protein
MWMTRLVNFARDSMGNTTQETRDMDHSSHLQQGEMLQCRVAFTSEPAKRAE